MRDFLRIAAMRHYVLHFDRIAEFYAHAVPPVQRLMENSCLVIIDYDRAIELGYVQMARALADMNMTENTRKRKNRKEAANHDAAL